MDCKTRKTMATYHALHQKANVERLHLLRKEGDQGLLSTEDCVNINYRALSQFLKISQEE